MATARYIVGIDLGTTNSALAYLDLEEATEEMPEPPVHVLEVPQLEKPGAVVERPLLPSFAFHPAKAEREKLDLSLPWAEAREHAVGLWARERGAERPGCLVASAKSWLSHAGVDREADLLPWHTSEEVEKVSPIEASARYLTHLREAFEHVVLEGDEKRIKKEGLGKCPVVLTIPASFDSVARELTMQAAAKAGLKNVTLLEEPQASFYAWLQAKQEAWRDEVNVDDVVLVCDVGGGTTDFTVIRVGEEEGDLTLERLAVGEHLLVGGDNMDLLLAHTLRSRIQEEKGKSLDTQQMLALIRLCSSAKETLLAGEKEAVPISVLGSGSKMIGGTIKVELKREDVEQVLVEGFFPEAGRDDRPARGAKLGLREVGLPYASDAAITRHLAAFLATASKSGSNGGSDEVEPTAVLFNGGVMMAPQLRERVVGILGDWYGEAPRVLTHASLELAVSQGAVRYGFTQTLGKGIRIRGGVAQTYYLGVEGAAPAVPGLPTPMRALCVLPFGTEEGSTVELPSAAEFELVVGETAEFPFLASPVRKEDAPGELLEETAELSEIARLEATVEPSDGQEPGSRVPVRLEVDVTEVGTLRVYCVERDNPERRHELEVNVRTINDR